MTAPSRDRGAIEAAFDNALRQVDRARRSGMTTRGGADAVAHLQHLEDELRAHRDESHRQGRVDGDWIGRVVRDVSDWVPDTDVTLLAALGVLARLRSAGA